MPAEVHHGSHFRAAFLCQAVGDVQRAFLVFGIKYGDVQFICQADSFQQVHIGHLLYVGPDHPFLRGPEVFLVSEHFLVGITGIEAIGTQLLA